MQSHAFREGGALITCAIVLVVATVLALGIAAMSGANTEIADNQRGANQAFAGAESGLEVTRYWIAQIRMPSSTPVAAYLSTAISDLQTELAARGVSCFSFNNDGSIPAVVLDASANQAFSGQLSVDPTDPAVLRLCITGTSHDAARTIRVNYRIEPYRFPIFNYGIATRGAIQFPRNPTFTGLTENWEADIYIESAASVLAFQAGGNCNFDGDIDIGNPLGLADFGGAVQIAGEYGQTAIDNHITIGADPVEFPVPETTRFQTYATGPVIGPTTNLANSMTLVNASIQAGANPTFLGNVTIQGILFIEAPNVVRFTQNVSQQGIIVASGDVSNPAANRISFEGNFASGPYPAGTPFDALRREQGSSIVAPGFGVSFSGNFSSVNGVLAASGLDFSANASATVKGTLISYSSNATVVDGNISMSFDRAQMAEIPAGFDLLRVLVYDPASYTVVF